MSNTVKIYVSLLDEGVQVWRPVQAEHLHDNVYRIAIQPYDRTTESWEFGPGDVVLCENVEAEEGPIVAAPEGQPNETLLGLL